MRTLDFESHRFTSEGDIHNREIGMLSTCDECPFWPKADTLPLELK